MKAQTQQARIALLPACLVAIIVGILGMHVFNQHGAMPDRNTVHHAADAVTAERLTAQADAAAAAGPASHDETTTLLTPDTSAVPRVNDSGRSTSDMVMLCAAMLLGVAGSVLLAVRLRRIFAGVGLDVGRLRPVIASLIPARVGTGPPYLWEFSVIRC